MPTTLLLALPDLKTYLHLCYITQAKEMALSRLSPSHIWIDIIQQALQYVKRTLSADVIVNLLFQARIQKLCLFRAKMLPLNSCGAMPAGFPIQVSAHHMFSRILKLRILNFVIVFFHENALLNENLFRIDQNYQKISWGKKIEIRRFRIRENM